MEGRKFNASPDGLNDETGSACLAAVVRKRFISQKIELFLEIID
jgi:hypothetical protein